MLRKNINRNKHENILKLFYLLQYSIVKDLQFINHTQKSKLLK